MKVLAQYGRDEVIRAQLEKVQAEKNALRFAFETVREQRDTYMRLYQSECFRADVQPIPA